MNTSSLDHLIQRFQDAGQGHVFKFFHNLSDPRKQEFLNSAQQIDLNYVTPLINQALIKSVDKENLSNLLPVDPFSFSSAKQEKIDHFALIKKGEELLRAGRVAALVVAGGQGTRLGFHGPKGTLPITPIKKKSFFQLFAEKIKAAQDSYQSVIPWLIMTSESNYKDTLDFFNHNNNFGLKDVHFFNQSLLPVIDFNGKFLLDEHGLIAMAPDGHGGSFESLVRSGLISKMEERGIDLISYFQVDNPLVKCIDPLFIGLHTSAASQMSSKVIKKLDPTERVGIFCQDHGRLKVLEYSHAPKDILTKRGPNGDLLFNAANIAVHLIDLDFIKKMGGPNALPSHHARKAVPFLDDHQRLILPDEPNCIKFEKLIFDALAEAKNPILMEVSREEEFSPVKNIQGKDSPASCINDQLRQSVRWLKAANVDIPCTKDGLPLFNIEISPTFADTQDSFVLKWKSLSEKLEILAETYLE